MLDSRHRFVRPDPARFEGVGASPEYAADRVVPRRFHPHPHSRHCLGRAWPRCLV